MPERLAREFRQDLDRLASTITDTEEATAKIHDYYRSASFLRALESGQPAAFRTGDDPRYFSDLGLFGGRDLLSKLSARAHPLVTRYEPHLFRAPGITLAYAGSRRLRTLLDGVATILDLDHSAEPENADSAEQADLIVLGYPVDGDPADMQNGGSSPARALQALAAKLSKSSTVSAPIVLLTTGSADGLSRTVPIARHCDLVVTFGDRSVEFLEEKLGGAPEVWQVPPFFSPVVHGPVGRNRASFEGGLFWGEWPAPIQKLRWASLFEVFDAFATADVPLAVVEPELFGEMEYTKEPRLPWQFARNAVPAPDPTLEPALRKLFDFHVLANLHPGQPWSFPLELLPTLASGAVPIATYSVGMNNEFPHVLLADSGEDVALELALMRDQPEVRNERQTQSIRRAFEKFTADRFLSALAGRLGISLESPTARVEVRANSEEARVSFLDTQRVPESSGISLVPAGEEDPAAVIRFTPQPGIEYGPYALLDAVHGFRMSSADAVVLATNEHSQEQQFEISAHETFERVDAVWLAPKVEEVPGRVRTVSRRDPAQVLVVGSGQAQKREQGPVNVAVRESRRELTVVVPVYNNGRYLEGKCFASLQRSSIFPRMRVHLIDDGSTSAETISIVRRLAERYPNVDAHFFETGGSGSASRPRNYGLEHASTEYVTYLDPDNEATGDGYARLLSLVRATGVDFAIGNMVRLAKARTLIRNVDVLRRAIDVDERGVGTVGGEVLPTIGFQPMSIQALIADTSWLRSTGIEQPLGALGQDSLFFQMMLHEARQIALLDEPIHSYYGEVAGSMVNTVTPGFFRKYLPLERARSEWLRREGLFAVYTEARARAFFRVWFWPRFNDRVAPEHKTECFEVLRELAGIYGIAISLSGDGQTLVEEQ